MSNPKIILPKVYDENAYVWHIFSIRTKNKDEFQEYLKQNDI